MEPTKADILAGYGRARQALDAWLEGATAADLRRRSNGTRWTNEELLFHMVFGYMVVRALLPMVHVISRLPTPVGKAFAAVLNAGTRPFDVVNYWGSRAASLVYNKQRMGRKLEKTITAIARRLERESTAIPDTVDAVPGQVGPVLRPDHDTQRRLRLPHSPLRLPRPAAKSQPTAPIGEHEPKERSAWGPAALPPARRPKVRARPAPANRVSCAFRLATLRTGG